MTDLPSLETRLVAYALAYPEAAEEWPWDERVVKVRGKIFAFLGIHDGALRLGVKLPASREFALVFPFAAPMAYGLGKSGWITVRLGPDDDADPDLLEGWIDESYRTVAPKRLSRALPEAG